MIARGDRQNNGPYVSARTVIVGPGEGDRVGSVEVLARTKDTPRFNLEIIEMAP